MPRMKDSGVRWIGNIPYKWSINRLKYNIECFDGRRIPIDASLRVEGPYPYWGAGNITDYVDDYIFNEELVLLGEDGAPFFDEYRPVAFLVNEPIWVNNHIHVLKGNKNILNKFLTYFLNIVQYDVYINGSIINKLTQGNMNNINIAIPSIEEQRLITTFLDDKVGKTEKILKYLNSQIDILNKYKKSLITETVTKGLNTNAEMKNSGIEWIGDIPKNWKLVRTLNMLAMPITDGPHTTPDLFNEGIPFVSAEAVSCGNGRINFNHIRGYISEEFYKECCRKYIPQKDDIYMIKSGATTGKVAIVDTKKIFTIWSPLAVFRCNKEKMLHKFMFYCLQADSYQKQVENGWTYGTQQNIGMRTLEHLKLCQPPIKEQEVIVKFLDKKCKEIDDLISKKQAQIEKMEKYKKSLIYEYVTGKKRVKGAEELYG